jgi:hypothetical protein
MFEFSEDYNYLMPAHFTGYPGRPQPGIYHDVTVISIAYETDAGVLASLVPKPFELTQGVLNVQYSVCRQVDWMGGGGYNLVSAGVPVAHVGQGERLEGVYVLLILENRTPPILSGREQTGMPKIFADIEDPHQLGPKIFTVASYEGASFLRLDFEQVKPMNPGELAALNQSAGNMNAFGWRYIPNIGRPGAALSHATLFPQQFAFTEAWAGKGEVQWETLSAERAGAIHYGPFTQAFKALPIKGYRESFMARGSLALRNDLARQLS